MNLYVLWRTLILLLQSWKIRAHSGAADLGSISFLISSIYRVSFLACLCITYVQMILCLPDLRRASRHSCPLGQAPSFSLNAVLQSTLKTHLHSTIDLATTISLCMSRYTATIRCQLPMTCIINSFMMACWTRTISLVSAL